MATATTYEHVVLNDEGVPHIRGTTMKVVEVVREHLAWAMDAEDIRKGHPDLTLQQVHSALAYYYENREDVDRDIERRDRLVEQFFADRQESDKERAFRRKMQAARRARDGAA